MRISGNLRPGAAAIMPALNHQEQRPPMGEIIAFANSHPLLASSVVVFLLAVLAYEIRLKGQGLVQVSSQMAVQLINKGATIIDVRPPEAFAQGHIANARNLPLNTLVGNPDPLNKKKDRPLLTVCDTGPAGRRAANVLRKIGYGSAFSLQGGLTAWRGDNLPLVK
jgi:rhodanese-related sulfurtransferase